MNYPKLNEIPTTRDLLDKFKGYNHNLRIGEGEFYDMKNLTGDDYPILSPRKKRGTAFTTTRPNGMCSNTKFCYVDGRYFYIDDTPYDLKLTDDKKELVSIGSNVVVMPDQKYINTVKVSERGNLRLGVFDLPDKIQGSDIEPKLKIVAIRGVNDTTFVAIETPLLIARAGQKLPTATAELKDAIAFVWNQNPTGTSSKPQPPQYEVRHCEYQIGGTYTWSERLPMGDRPNNSGFKIGIYSEDDDTEYWEYTISEIEKATAEDKSVILGGLYEGMSNVSRILYSTKFQVDGVEKKGLVIDMFSAWRGLPDPTDRNAFVEWLFEGVDTVQTRTTATPISVETPEAKNSIMPKLDYIIESENRLWGCKYGLNNNGEWVNEIYSSRLGDFKDWVVPDPVVSTSPYRINVGTSGKFTGAINYGGKPIFFKEDCMHRVFGDYTPYSCVATPCKGVQEGCSKSLVIVNDVLYYKSRTGICAYDGSLPVEISSNFGDKQYTDAVGGAIGNKYYISMKDVETGEHEMFVYDTVKRLWHKEDNTQATQFCNHQGNLYYISRDDNFIHVVKGTGDDSEAPIKWGAETGILGATTPDDKYVTRIDLRMSVAKGSKVSLHIEYDSMGEWERLMEIEGLTLNTFTVPVIPRRCDHFRLKFEGEGDAKIFSISKTLEESE